MRSVWIFSSIAIALLAHRGLGADEAGAALAKQKLAAEANWKLIQGPPGSLRETGHLLVYGAVPEDKLKFLGGRLERQYGQTVTALRFDKGEAPWPGKLAVYLFSDRAQFRSFVRQIEKRSPDDLEQGCAALAGDLPHIAAGPGKSKESPSLDNQAGHELAAALLSARAKAAPLPEWVVVGFGRASVAHAAGHSPGLRKKFARDLIRARMKPRDTWNDAYPLEQRLTLGTAIMDYITYGKGVARPNEFLSGFRPDDEKPMKTVDDALSAAKLTLEQFEAAFLKWLVSSR